ncbi:MAG: hypothetical protein FJZ97_11240 [Chloroflexi bacterium]|nr:hypothetical protein [Chloroflexota bacterium]
MFSSPIVYAWIAWLLVIGVIAVLRFAAHQREERRRVERRSQRRTGQAAGSAPDKALVVRRPKTTKPPSIPADYREQLVAAGIIQPAVDLAAPDPATQV